MHIIHTIPQVLWAYSTTWQRPPVCLDDQERERTRERECVYPRRHVGLTSTVVSTGSRGDLECGSVQQQNSQSIQPRTQRNRGTSPLDPPTQPHKSRVKFNSQCRSLVEISTKLRSKFGRNFDQTSIKLRSKFGRSLHANFDHQLSKVATLPHGLHFYVVTNFDCTPGGGTKISMKFRPTATEIR